MKQLTLRGFEPELARSIQDLARREGISLNQAVLKLLRRATGLEASPDDRIGHSLDHLAGTWTREDERAFLGLIEDFNQIDEELWQ